MKVLRSTLSPSFSHGASTAAQFFIEQRNRLGQNQNVLYQRKVESLHFAEYMNDRLWDDHLQDKFGYETDGSLQELGMSRLATMLFVG